MVDASQRVALEGQIAPKGIAFLACPIHREVVARGSQASCMDGERNNDLSMRLHPVFNFDGCGGDNCYIGVR